ncbi:hypothetical protein GSB9_00783 [Flavobacteriaceae bacterium GSB9]|nr:hypothetical protein GSB9_00783 [Flavobacteriaceae bacterium GSB9]
MKLLYIKRNTKYEKRYTLKMGELTTRITSIKRYVFGLPIQTLHERRRTYYGQVKNYDDRMLFV